MSGYFYVCKIN